MAAHHSLPERLPAKRRGSAARGGHSQTRAALKESQSSPLHTLRSSAPPRSRVSFRWPEATCEQATSIEASARQQRRLRRWLLRAWRCPAVRPCNGIARLGSRSSGASSPGETLEACVQARRMAQRTGGKLSSFAFTGYLRLPLCPHRIYLERKITDLWGR